MNLKITHIVFDCNCDDEDWTEYDVIETADFLASRYVETVWAVDNEDDLVDAISDRTGWCIIELDCVPVDEVAQYSTK
jgi:hypothetical protein